VVELTSLGLRFPVAAIYQDTSFMEKAPEETDNEGSADLHQRVKRKVQHAS